MGTLEGSIERSYEKYVINNPKRIQIGMLLAFLTIWAWTGVLHADDRFLWRSWGVRDGFTETYSYAASMTPGGSAYFRHGAVFSMSLFDGYSVTRIPDPRGNAQPDWPSTKRVYAVPGGTLWTASLDALKEYRDGKWTVRFTPPAGRQVLAAVPTGRRVMVLMEDGLREFDPEHQSWREIRTAKNSKIAPFLELCPGTGDELYITGEHGMAKLHISRDGDAFEWVEVNSDAYHLAHFEYPLPGTGELFAQGISSRDKRHVIVRWSGSRLESVYAAAADNLRGWRGGDGSVWIGEGESIFRLRGGRKYPMERTEVLTGTIFDVYSEAGKAFWVTTSEGITRYTPPLWRPPAGMEEFDLAVHAIAEDRQGRLWMSATDYVLELDGNTWTRHALPAGFHTLTVETSSLAPLPDGRVLVRVVREDRADLVLALDPNSGRFTELPHPEGRVITLLAQRPAGGVWVGSEVKGTPGFRLDVYDGVSFRKVLELGSEWQGANLRSVLERGQGEIWLGGTAGGGLYRDGQFSDPFQRSNGYTDVGVFVLGSLPRGELVAGGRNQILKYNGKSWTAMRDGMDRVRYLTTTRDGALWVASGSGVHRFRDGSWISHQPQEGLPSVMAYIVFQDSKGRLWAGTTGGLVLYHPEADADAPRTILDPALNLREISPSGEARITFSGIDKWNQTPPERLFFSYRLDGGIWSPFQTSNPATYHRMPAGRHRFEVRSMDRNGNIDPAGVSFEFHVLPHWYWNAWFLVISSIGAAVICGLLVLAVHNFRQLRRAKITAESATRAKSEFLARMSHEIRTPMNAILGMADLLWASKLNVEQRQYVGAFRGAGHNLLTLINDILDLSKIEAGRIDLQSVDFDLEELVAVALDLMRVRADDKGLDIVCELSPEIHCALRGDPDRLRQVLINLLGNAVKFTEAGQVTLRIEREPVEADGLQTLRFSVSDTGPGIPLDKQSLIFETFSQADSSIIRQYGGTGLGLTISRQIVERMGGRLEVSSIPGKGSTFNFSIPFEMAAKLALRPDSTVCLSSEQPVAGLHILLAEDSKDNQLLISAYLKQTGWTMEIAADGQAAVDKFTSGRFDLVLMDVQMPVMDGYTATRTIREWEARQGARRTPILALSAHAMGEAFEKSREAGCDAHLTKPITKPTLLRAIAEHSKARGAICVRPSKEVEELVPQYLDMRRSDLAALAAALQAGDYDAIRVIGHNMKGSGAGYGFDAITKIGASLEAAAKKESAGLIGTEISELGDYLDRVKVLSS